MKISQQPQRVAVIGAGISGLASAYFLSKAHDVVLFEAGDYIGGHTNTVDVSLEGKTAPVDTGFLVCNPRTYPNLLALFAELGVETYGTDMSFAVSMDKGKLEWAGTNLNTVFAQRKNLLSPRFIGMLQDILRFNREAEANLERVLRDPMTLGELLLADGYGATFQDTYLIPMAAAIWSSSSKDILSFPASTFIRFCLNHSLLQVKDRPQWLTVKGGAKTYVQKIVATLPDVRDSTPVKRVDRYSDYVEVTTQKGTERFDQVVFATHAPTSLQLLSEASEAEKSVLAACRYQANEAILHTDRSQLPVRESVWSAWNYLGGQSIAGERSVCVTYLLNQLQRLPFTQPVMVTLNPFSQIDEEKVIARFQYEHPIFDTAAIAAQVELVNIQGKNRTWFAGAWGGYGFHEDGLKSALRVAREWGLAPDWTVLP